MRFPLPPAPRFQARLSIDAARIPDGAAARESAVAASRRLRRDGRCAGGWIQQRFGVHPSFSSAVRLPAFISVENSQDRASESIRGGLCCTHENHTDYLRSERPVEVGRVLSRSSRLRITKPIWIS